MKLKKEFSCCNFLVFFPFFFQEPRIQEESAIIQIFAMSQVAENSTISCACQHKIETIWGNFEKKSYIYFENFVAKTRYKTKLSKTELEKRFRSNQTVKKIMLKKLIITEIYYMFIRSHTGPKKATTQSKTCEKITI